MAVYGPTIREDKGVFLAELANVRAVCTGQWMICADFNLIYQVADKNNGWLHRGLMCRFCHTLDSLELIELSLSNRHFTWSSERDTPTLERLDRVFASVDWVEQHPYYLLRTLSLD